MPTEPTGEPGREAQRDRYLEGLAGRAPIVPTDPRRLEAAARRIMSRETYAYIAGGAGVERTMAANRAAFDRWRIVPRVLRDASARDLSVELFGRRFPAPILLAPLGALDMIRRNADLLVARAAAAEGIPDIFSSQAGTPMERCAAAMGEAPRWFQLYWSRLDRVVESFVGRAEACGCAAIVLTLDTTLLGWRPRDLDLGSLPFLRGYGIAQYTSDPAFLDALHAPPAEPAARPPVTAASIAAFIGQLRRHPGGVLANLRSGQARRAVQRFVATYSRPSLTWSDLAALRRLTSLPIVLKGILHPDDARLALEHGGDGVIVSNHGGRQVDGAVAALDALPGVVDAVGGRIPVLFDSGIRTGADVFKAVALGARAVLLGRPVAYGLAVAGEAGVRAVIRNLVAEYDLTLGLSGWTSTSRIDPSALQSD